MRCNSNAKSKHFYKESGQRSRAYKQTSFVRHVARYGDHDLQAGALFYNKIWAANVSCIFQSEEQKDQHLLLTTVTEKSTATK